MNRTAVAEPMSADRMLVTVRQACEQLQVSRWTLNRLMKTGELTSLKIGRRRYISPKAISAFIECREKAEEGSAQGG